MLGVYFKVYEESFCNCVNGRMILGAGLVLQFNHSPKVIRC